MFDDAIDAVGEYKALLPVLYTMCASIVEIRESITTLMHSKSMPRHHEVRLPITYR